MHYLEAEYESGYVHSNQHQDISPYTKTVKVDGVPTGENIFKDILNKRPEEFHGRMVRFSLVMPDNTYTIDWTKLPDNSRPIYARDVEQDFIGLEPSSPKRIKEIRFGYQYTDKKGKNVQEMETINA